MAKINCWNNVCLKRTVILDPGHGGKDSGAVWKGNKEKDIALDIALRTYGGMMAECLPILTMSLDVYAGLQWRVYLANRYGASCFVSIHTNADPDPDLEGDPVATGAEILIFPQQAKSRRLAESIHGGLADISPRWRGIKERSDLYVIQPHVRCPAVLIEVGFTDNPEFYHRDRDKIAKAIVKGIDNFLDRSVS